MMVFCDQLCALHCAARAHPFTLYTFLGRVSISPSFLVIIPFCFRAVRLRLSLLSTVLLLSSTMDRKFREQYVSLYGTETTSIYQAMKYFRQMLSRPIPDASNLAMEPTVKGSMVPRFVDLLNRYDHPNIQMEAAWALTNLACGTAVETWMLVAVGAAQKLVELITRSPNAEVRDQAIWAVSNVAGDSHECREYLLKIGTLEACLSEFNRFRHRRYVPTSKTVEARRNLIWTLSNLCRTRSTSSFPWYKFAPVVTVIQPLLTTAAYTDDDELLAEACWTLAYMMDGQQNWSPVQAVIDAGLVEPMINLLGADSSNRVLSAAVRAIGNIVTGTTEQTQAVLDAGVLPKLRPLLKHEGDSLVREACWLLSNITAGTEQQIAAVLDCPDLFATTVIMTAGHRSPQVRREAAWAVCNALSSGDPAQKRRVVSFGCVRPIVQLCATSDDARLLEALLAALDVIVAHGRDQQDSTTFGHNTYATMVSECGGVPILQRLAQNGRWSMALRTRCLLLLSEYFENHGPIGQNRGDQAADKDKEPIVIKFKRNRATKAGM